MSDPIPEIDLTHKIGLRLREARKAEALTLAQLSGRTQSLSKSRISNYEQGLRRMGIEEAQGLAAALGTVSATYLLCLDDDVSLTGREHKLVTHFRNADERGKEAILRMAEIEASSRTAERA